MGKIIDALGPSFERLHLFVKANPDKWKGRWYGLLKREWGDEKRHDQQLVTVKERFIPKASARAESFTKGLDPGNLDPIESLNKNPNNTNKYQANREGARMIKGYGISPGPNYQGVGDRDRGRSRSRSRGKYDVRPSDVASLKALYKDHNFNTLKSPKEAETKMRASSPSTSTHDYQKAEGENRPQMKLLYGVARKPMTSEVRNPSDTNHPSSSQGCESHEGNGGTTSDAKQTL
jgi:hypothetical protein